VSFNGDTYLCKSIEEYQEKREIAKQKKFENIEIKLKINQSLIPKFNLKDKIVIDCPGMDETMF
jgi:hypothetical protein